METQTFGERVKRTGKKVLRIVIISVIVILTITFGFMYWGVYEDGVMAGKILRVSEKGMMFKTYEGKINLETFGALREASPIAESFDFSIEKSDEALIAELKKVSLTGERVNLYFVKRYMTFPWRGDTKYFATKVERLGK
ncbi:hypothetical protein WBG78_13540 [Chryseolinea sp. T2]|uniref:hypothetical protein n=1 Tax=Chryseolinea sp. T2 TaxID=3129255 RepID=UPI00307738E1